MEKCHACGVDLAPHATTHDCLEQLRAVLARLVLLNDSLARQLGMCRRALDEQIDY